jgi:hypothetical protein
MEKTEVMIKVAEINENNGRNFMMFIGLNLPLNPLL